MHIYGQAFRLQKDGNSADEYEDAFWPPGIIAGKYQEFKCAVADGATETSFSSVWAMQLVRAYCRKRLEPNVVNRSIACLSHAWQSYVTRNPLPWYAEEKVRWGAFSSILGLTLTEAENKEKPGRWRAIAVGDTCVFQVRNNDCIEAFPLTSSAQFGSRPILIPSVLGADGPCFPSESREGLWEHGDEFYVMTDALACWFLKDIESESRPWDLLRDLDTIDEPITFKSWIQRLRYNGLLKNDDVTLFRVTVT